MKSRNFGLIFSLIFLNITFFKYPSLILYVFAKRTLKQQMSLVGNSTTYFFEYKWISSLGWIHIFKCNSYELRFFTPLKEAHFELVRPQWSICKNIIWKIASFSNQKKQNKYTFLSQSKVFSCITFWAFIPKYC